MRVDTNCLACEHFPNSLFSGMERDRVTALNEEMTAHIYRRGQVVFFEDRAPVGVYCLRKGKVKISKVTADGKEQIVRIVNEGGILGLKSMVGSSKHTTTAMTLEDSEICYIPKASFAEIMTECSSVSSKVMLYLISSLEDAENRIASLAHKPVRQRVAEVLVMLQGMYGPDENGIVWICISREDLASVVGTATATVIRLLAEFKDMGLIETQGRRIRILDTAAMKTESNV